MRKLFFAITVLFLSFFIAQIAPTTVVAEVQCKKGETQTACDARVNAELDADLAAMNNPAPKDKKKGKGKKDKGNASAPNGGAVPAPDTVQVDPEQWMTVVIDGVAYPITKDMGPDRAHYQAMWEMHYKFLIAGGDPHDAKFCAFVAQQVREDRRVYWDSVNWTVIEKTNAICGGDPYSKMPAGPGVVVQQVVPAPVDPNLGLNPNPPTDNAQVADPGSCDAQIRAIAAITEVDGKPITGCQRSYMYIHGPGLACFNSDPEMKSQVDMSSKKCERKDEKGARRVANTAWRGGREIIGSNGFQRAMGTDLHNGWESNEGGDVAGLVFNGIRLYQVGDWVSNNWVPSEWQDRLFGRNPAVGFDLGLSGSPGGPNPPGTGPDQQNIFGGSGNTGGNPAEPGNQYWLNGQYGGVQGTNTTWTMPAPSQTPQDLPGIFTPPATAGMTTAGQLATAGQMADLNLGLVDTSTAKIDLGL